MRSDYTFSHSTESGMVSAAWGAALSASPAAPDGYGAAAVQMRP